MRAKQVAARRAALKVAVPAVHYVAACFDLGPHPDRAIATELRQLANFMDRVATDGTHLAVGRFFGAEP